MAVDAPFDLRYQPLTPNAVEGEREIGADDLDTAYYENDEIDLEQLMQEQFYPRAADEAAVQGRLQGAVRHVRHEPEQGDVRLQPHVGRPAPRDAQSL